MEAGSRGASSKESASDLVLACLGYKSLSRTLRLTVRKNRARQQGQEFPFTCGLWGRRNPTTTAAGHLHGGR